MYINAINKLNCSVLFTVIIVEYKNNWLLHCGIVVIPHCNRQVISYSLWNYMNSSLRGGEGGGLSTGQQINLHIWTLHRPPPYLPFCVHPCTASCGSGSGGTGAGTPGSGRTGTGTPGTGPGNLLAGTVRCATGTCCRIRFSMSSSSSDSSCRILQFSSLLHPSLEKRF